jgi:hypothetical protein
LGIRKLMNDSRFIALFDIHAGHDWWHTDNGLVSRPAHDLGMCRLAAKFVKDFEPSHIIFCGDQIHSSSISHWNKEKVLSHVKDSYTDELDLLRDKIIAPIIEAAPSNAQAVFMDGNHERFGTVLKEKFPQLQKLLDPHAYLGVSGPNGKKSGWTYISQGGRYDLGKLHFIHGDILKAGIGHARSAVYEWNCNLRYGHFHTFCAATKCGQVSERDKKTAMSVPMLGAHNPEFLKGAANAWMQGFLYGYVSKSGNFSDYVVIVPGREVIINGKAYNK